MKKLVLLTLAAFFLMGGMALADPSPCIELNGPNYQVIAPTIDPATLVDYPSGWTPYTSLGTVTGKDFALGMNNLTVKENIKWLYLKLEWTGGGTVDLLGTGAGWVFPKSQQPEYSVDNSPAGGDGPGWKTITAVYDPQPEYEYFIFRANGAVENVQVTMVTVCCPMAYPSGIPTLTEWGMITLVLMILAAGGLVIVRRRRATVVA